jgi:hypothetical protein
MDFVRSHFEKMNLWQVEHFFEHIWITFGWVCCCTHSKWWQICSKKCKLVRVSSFRSDFLQNPYFSPPVFKLWDTQGYLWLPYDLAKVLQLIKVTFKQKNFFFKKILYVIPSALVSFLPYYCQSFRIIVISRQR